MVPDKWAKEKSTAKQEENRHMLLLQEKKLTYRLKSLMVQKEREAQFELWFVMDPWRN